MRRYRLPLMVCAVTALALPQALTQQVTSQVAQPVTEAPAAYDGQTNGFLTPSEFAVAKQTFEEQEFNNGTDGLGPVYNAQSCAECHQSPVTGGTSQITEPRAGHFDVARNVFVDHPGGSLINDRAINAAFQESIMWTRRAMRARPAGPW